MKQIFLEGESPTLKSSIQETNDFLKKSKNLPKLPEGVILFPIHKVRL